MDASVRLVMADDRACVILKLVLENPGSSLEKLADRALAGQDELQTCLEHLLGAGLIEQDSRAGYSVTEAAKLAVIRHLPLNYQCPGLLR